MKKYFCIFCLFSIFLYAFSEEQLSVQENDSEIELVQSELIEPYKMDETNDNQCSVVIKTNVSRASVYINENYQGKGELKIQGLVPGEYEVTVSKKGYVSVKKRIIVKYGYDLFYYLELLLEEKK